MRVISNLREKTPGGDLPLYLVDVIDILTGLAIDCLCGSEA